MSDEEKVYTTVDAVNLASDGNVNEFKSAIGDIMMDKIQSAIEIKKYEVQSNLWESRDSRGIAKWLSKDSKRMYLKKHLDHVQ